MKRLGARNGLWTFGPQLRGEALRERMAAPGAPRCDDCGGDLEDPADYKREHCLRSAARFVAPLAVLLLALAPAAHAGGLGGGAPMGPGTWALALAIAAFAGKVLLGTALVLSPLALPRLMAWAEDLLIAWVWRARP